MLAMKLELCNLLGHRRGDVIEEGGHGADVLPIIGPLVLTYITEYYHAKSLLTPQSQIAVYLEHL